MNVQSYGRGGGDSNRRSSTKMMSPSTNKEKRTVDVVKSVLAKIKEKLLSSGPLLVEEETAINQLEQLYAAKFSRSMQENEECQKDFTSQPLDGNKRRDEDSNSPFLSTPLAARRDSDASFSNETHLSKYMLAKVRGDYYYGRDPWRRQYQRRRRLEMRKLVEPLTLRVDEAKGVCLVRATASVYDELLLQGKPPLAAYDLLITTLRSYFAGETWPELVEPYVAQFVRDRILLSAAQVTEKYTSGLRGDAEPVDERKLQVLLHLHALAWKNGDGCDAKDGKLEKILDLLRMIALSFDGSSIIQKFLDEDILESFLDIIPRNLAYIYEELNAALPSELSTFASDEKVKKTSDRASSNSKSKVSTAVSNSTTSKTLEGARKTKRTLTTSWKNVKREGVSTSVAKKAKIERNMDDIEEVVEPEAPIEEIAIKEEKPVAECRPKRPKLVAKHRLADVIAEASSDSVLVSVRQSPRHHASTRALYGSTSSTLSLFLQKEQADEGTFNGCSTIPTSSASTSDLLNNESTRLVLVKDKRGYFLKKFAGDGHDEEESSAKKTKPKKKSVGTKMEKGRPKKVDRQKKTPSKAVGKLKLEKEKNGKKSWATCGDRDGGGKKALGKKSKSNLLADNVPSFTSATSSRSLETTKNNRLASNRRGDQAANPESKAATKGKELKLRLTKAEKIDNGHSKSKPKSAQADGDNSAYVLPGFAVENYVKHVNEIRRERKRGRDEEELFYARGTRRHSIFYDGGSASSELNTSGGSGGGSSSPISKCYTDEQMAPKSRSGRKMKSSVELFDLANYLLNVQNGNPSAPAIPKTLQQALNTPIRLYKKLRLAPKNNRRRSLRQFCALKFNADEFVDNGNGISSTSSSSTVGANDADECASLEFNCGDVQIAASPNEEPPRNDLKMKLTIDTRLADDESPRRNSVSVCAGLSKWRPPSTSWHVEDGTNSKSGYYMRRRRLFSDGHMASKDSSIISPDSNGIMKREKMGRRRGAELEDAAMKLRDVKDVLVMDSEFDRRRKAETELILISGQILDQSRTAGDGEEGGGAFLNRLTSHAGGLLQLANSSSLICTGLAAVKNYAQVATDVR